MRLSLNSRPLVSRLFLPGMLALALAWGLLPAPSAEGQSDRRIADDRDLVAAAAAVSRSAFAPGAATRAVLSRSDVFADALAGAPLAGTKGPVLFTDGGPTAGPRQEALDEIARALGTARGCETDQRVYILGGTQAVSSATETAIRGLGYCVERLAGETRVETSVKVAEVVREQTGSRTVLIATSAKWADALTAGAYAAASGTPLIVTPANELAPAVKRFVFLHDPQPTELVLLGGTAALSAKVEADAAAFAPTRRVYGRARDETAIRIVDQLWGRSSMAGVTLVNGYAEHGWAYALAATPVAARERAPLVYVSSEGMSDVTAAWLNEVAYGFVIAAGDKGTVSQEAYELAVKRKQPSGSSGKTGPGSGGSGGGGPAPAPAPALPPAPPITASPAGAPPIGSTNYPIPGGAIFVSPSGNDSSGTGSSAAPYRTLQRAVNQAPSGATIVLRAGTYREETTWIGKRLTIQPYPREAVWFSGSIPVTGWVRDGSVWRKDGWTAKFEQGGVDSKLVDATFPYAAHPDMVFINGEPLRQVGSRSEVVSGTFAVNYSTNQLFIGNDPTGKLVEGAVLSESIYINGGPGSVIQGIGFRHFATHRSRLAAVKAYGDGVVVRDSVFEYNATAGLSVRGTGNLVERNTLAHNGQLGLHAWRNDGLRVIGNHMIGNNFKRFANGSSQGGMKMNNSHGVVLADNLAEYNWGPGLWLDESIVGATIVRNTARNNHRHGIMFEISTQALIASNVVTGNAVNGIYVLESDNVDVYNNTMVDNGRNLMILEGRRTILDPNTPGHDKRFPIPQPGLTWDINKVVVRNNILSGGTSSTLVNVDDAEKKRSGWDMTVSLDHNAYHRPSSSTPRWLSGWSNYPTAMIASDTFSKMQSRTGQESNGMAFDNVADPFFRNRAAQDWRLRSDSPARGAGVALPQHVAAAIGVTAGTPVDLGALH